MPNENQKTLSLLYGDTVDYPAPRAVKKDELLWLGDRAAVACSDIAKGATGKVYVHGPFFDFNDIGVDIPEGGRVFYDFKRRRYAPADTPGARCIGVADLPCLARERFLAFTLNGTPIKR